MHKWIKLICLCIFFFKTRIACSTLLSRTTIVTKGIHPFQIVCLVEPIACIIANSHLKIKPFFMRQRILLSSLANQPRPHVPAPLYRDYAMSLWHEGCERVLCSSEAWDILGHFGVQKTQVEFQLHLGLRERLWTSDLTSLIILPYWVTVRIQ